MNLILIGMPGSGKSTAGVLSAKALCKSFLDTDLLIQGKAGRTLQTMIESDGIASFLACEEEAVCSIQPVDCVVATGGSVVYSARAMEHLRAIGRTLYLHLDYETMARRVGDIHTRGVVLKQGHSLHDMYQERLPLYQTYADGILDCSACSVEETVEAIVRQTLIWEKGES